MSFLPFEGMPRKSLFTGQYIIPDPLVGIIEVTNYVIDGVAMAGRGRSTCPMSSV